MKVNHGANLHDLSSEYGFSKEELMDFSSNINPLGASPLAKDYVVKNIDSVSIYPDPSYKNLKNSISSYCNCSETNILLGSGATELISSFIETVNPENSLLLSPAYSEYEKELNKIDSSITKYFAGRDANFKIDVNDLIDNIKANNYELVIICNPNNPTGFAFSKDEIELILKNTNGFVMIDETYIEFTNMDKYSSTSLVDQYDNIFVIRGTSKFFSTPGIRLGYGLISNEGVRDNISKNLDLWNINIFATMMGEVMFKDEEFINKTYDFVTREREFLLRELGKFSDFKVYNSDGNFILCEIVSKKFTAKELRDRLLNDKMIIRDCASFDGLDEYFFRVCVLSDRANRCLIDSLSSFLDFL